MADPEHLEISEAGSCYHVERDLNATELVSLGDIDEQEGVNHG